MPTSKSCLLDVNVWLVAAAERHVFHPKAKEWMSNTDARLLFCRVTQMGLLRLLTNVKVMGDERLAPADAWMVYQHFRVDSRVLWAGEPSNLETVWREMCPDVLRALNTWTDSYLAAFARNSGSKVDTDCMVLFPL
jgi:uncharacterized protein